MNWTWNFMKLALGLGCYLIPSAHAAVQMSVIPATPPRFEIVAGDGFPHHVNWQVNQQWSAPNWLAWSTNILINGSAGWAPPDTHATLFLRAALAAPPEALTNAWNEQLGNHRAWIEVTHPAPAVYTMLPWRQPVLNPAGMDLVLCDAQTGLPVTNAVRLAGTSDYGQMVFQPATAPGFYYLYFLPARQTGPWWLPRTEYPLYTNRADAAWLDSVQPAIAALTNGLPVTLPNAPVRRWEALSDFHQFSEMQQPASPREVSNLLSAAATQPFLVFPEDRHHSIRHSTKIPHRWAAHWPANSALILTGRPNEFLSFQLGVYAFRQALANVRVLSTPWQHTTTEFALPASALRCFNLAGTNWNNEPFTNNLAIAQGRIQALWLGLDLPAACPAGTYTSTLQVIAHGLPPVAVPVQMQMGGTAVPDRGDSDPSTLSRLRWLDSSQGISYETIPPFPPISLSNRTIRVLGREVVVGDDGLPASIKSFFSASNDRLLPDGAELLAEPLAWRITAAGLPLTYTNQALDFVILGTGALQWRATNAGAGFRFSVQATMESDGHLDFQTRFEPTATALALDDLALRLAMESEAARYFMGMGRKGAVRPAQHRWQWSAFANNYFWAGRPNAGLYLKLKHKTPRWDMSWLTLMYRDWYQSTNSHCQFAADEGAPFIGEAHVGPLLLNGPKDFNFSLIVTPFKTLPAEHFDWRYYHADRAPTLSTVTNAGANIINIHQDLALNPYLNYPFRNTNVLAQYVAAAHAHGVKVKLYYTVRELSVHAAEFWMLRSLGTEIFQSGNATKNGWSWLHEHLEPGFIPTWHQPLSNGHWDAAIATQGISRWHNYYIEGIRWLMEHQGLDGLYLDGLGYDRAITKRMRRILNATKPGCLLDLHSGNGFDPHYGNLTTACLYMEHFPYLDSIWFGEYFDYDLEGPDYWLVEISGIPFGLYGEMLGSQTNPWRGMVFGISSRLGWGGNPRHLWRVWDDFGIGAARFAGWWDPGAPVTCAETDIKVSCFVREGKTLVAIASWAPETKDITLSFDWSQLGLDPAQATLEAPPITDFQPARTQAPTDPIPVEPGRGWLFYLK